MMTYLERLQKMRDMLDNNGDAACVRECLSELLGTMIQHELQFKTLYESMQGKP